jgi:hypothetical protein
MIRYLLVKIGIVISYIRLFLTELLFVTFVYVVLPQMVHFVASSVS